MSSPKLCLFSHLTGNPAAKEILTRLVEKNTLPSVLLFHGPSGVGKALFAKAIAEKLMGKTKKDHPDIHILHPEGKSNHHPIQAIRQLIDDVGMPPFEAPCKVFIIHDAEKMLPSSSNALLKTLEEPPSDTYIFLISSEPDQLLPTIVSRCRKIPFFSIPKTLKIDHPDLSPLFQSKNYSELLQALSKFKEDPDIEQLTLADAMFEEILCWVQEHRPLHLERAFQLIQECRIAVAHHVKIKTILEYFFLSIDLFRG